MTIVVTGANGFVGSHLCRALQSRGMAYRAVVREGAQAPPGTADLVRLPSLDTHTDWATVLQDASTVIHLAARVHQLQDTSADPLQASWRPPSTTPAASLKTAPANSPRRCVLPTGC